MTHLSVQTAPPADGTATANRAVTLQFSNNALLPMLLGDHDRHLVRIEQALGVRMSCRGNRVAIAGEPGRVEAAQTTLQGLWRRLERGESIGRPEVEAAIKLSDIDNDPRLPLSDLPAIRTRRGAVGPRSPGQAVYMEALTAHEMVFGVGPAGTGKTYLAVAQAVAMLQAGKVDRIVLSRPAVEAGERLGFAVEAISLALGFAPDRDLARSSCIFVWAFDAVICCSVSWFFNPSAFTCSFVLAASAPCACAFPVSYAS